ncbi:unnamed protein product, partial [Cyprideis torosa]
MEASELDGMGVEVKECPNLSRRPRRLSRILSSRQPSAKIEQSGSFRYSIWDPWLIASQILSIQSIFYFGVGSLIALLDSFAGQVPSISQIFWYPCGWAVADRAEDKTMSGFHANRSRSPSTGLL